MGYLLFLSSSLCCGEQDVEITPEYVCNSCTVRGYAHEHTYHHQWVAMTSAFMFFESKGFCKTKSCTVFVAMVTPRCYYDKDHHDPYLVPDDSLIVCFFLSHMVLPLLYYGYLFHHSVSKIKPAIYYRHGAFPRESFIKAA